MIPPKEFIRKVRPFSLLTGEELDILISGLEVELFKKDRIVYRKGETRENIYIVFSGLVCLFDGACQLSLQGGSVRPDSFRQQFVPAVRQGH